MRYLPIVLALFMVSSEVGSFVELSMMSNAAKRTESVRKIINADVGLLDLSFTNLKPGAGDNVEDKNGGAVFITTNATLVCTITNCYFNNCSAPVSGGAIYASTISRLEVSGCKFFKCTSSGEDDLDGGGAIYMATGILYFQNSIIDSCVSGACGAGIFVSTELKAGSYIKQSDITNGKSAYSTGLDISLGAGNFEGFISNVLLSGNNASLTDGWGAGIYLTIPSEPVKYTKKCFFKKNVGAEAMNIGVQSTDAAALFTDSFLDTETRFFEKKEKLIGYVKATDTSVVVDKSNDWILNDNVSETDPRAEADKPVFEEEPGNPDGAFSLKANYLMIVSILSMILYIL